MKKERFSFLSKIYLQQLFYFYRLILLQIDFAKDTYSFNKKATEVPIVMLYRGFLFYSIFQSHCITTFSFYKNPTALFLTHTDPFSYKSFTGFQKTCVFHPNQQHFISSTSCGYIEPRYSSICSTPKPSCAGRKLYVIPQAFFEQH
jgi:hypothetical protein